MVVSTTKLSSHVSGSPTWAIVQRLQSLLTKSFCLFQAKLSMRVLGEQPLLVTTPYIWVNATQLSSVGNSLFSLGDVKFHMPTNLEKELNTVSVGSEGSCYGTMMTVYKENPFFSEMVRI